MTELLLRYPMQAFLVGLFLLACTVGWLLYLIAETITAHKKWREDAHRQ